MRYFSAINLLLAFFCISTSVNGQQSVPHARNAMEAGVRNYTSFTAPVINAGTEAIQNNPGYEHHPETGKLFPEAPCTDCYELIGKRTEISKTFIKEGTGGQ